MSSSGRTIAVGDIHGCDFALKTLLDALGLGETDTLVMLGDAIDRGPGSREVIDQLLALQQSSNLVPILGNHEQMLLDARDGRIPLSNWLMYGGTETLDSYGGDFDDKSLAEHIEFVRSWGDYYETPGHFFAHGNYRPDLPFHEQPWHLERWESLRSKMPEMHCSGKTAVLGHTSNKQGQVLNVGYLVCIDTYCHGGYWLTAFEPETGQLWQASQQGELQELMLPAPR